jgi:hypothetical protein
MRLRNIFTVIKEINNMSVLSKYLALGEFLSKVGTTSSKYYPKSGISLEERKKRTKMKKDAKNRRKHSKK